MVLLSGAAWGQMNYGWKFEDMKEANKGLSDCTGRFWAAMREKGIMVVTFEEKLQWCAENPPPPPWADSRYRLEKNEKTGHLRIMEYKCGEWKFFADQSGLLHRVWINEQEMTEWLEQLRKMEQVDKAWRPIR